MDRGAGLAPPSSDLDDWAKSYSKQLMDSPVTPQASRTFFGSGGTPQGGASRSFFGGATPQASPAASSSFLPPAVSVMDGGASMMTPGPQESRDTSSSRALHTPLRTPSQPEHVSQFTPFSGVKETRTRAPDDSVWGASEASTQWVTVFGFAPHLLDIVIESFLSCGQILKHETEGHANWVHLLFESPEGAMRALGRNSTVLDGSVMLGVVKRSRAGHSGPGMLFSQSSAMDDTPHKSKSLANESLYLQRRNQYSVTPVKTAKQASAGAPRPSEGGWGFVNYLFGY